MCVIAVQPIDDLVFLTFGSPVQPSYKPEASGHLQKVGQSLLS